MRAILSIAALLVGQALAEPAKPELARQIYLKCPQANEPDGVSDIHIDFERRVITDSFAMVRQFKEEGPYLIIETSADVQGKQITTSTLRVNRYTYLYEFIAPPLNIYRRIQCIPIDRKM